MMRRCGRPLGGMRATDVLEPRPFASPVLLQENCDSIAGQWLARGATNIRVHVAPHLLFMAVLTGFFA